MPISLAQRERQDELAPYFVEEIRQYLEKTYGTSAVQESGLQVYSTLNVDMQKAANAAAASGPSRLRQTPRLARRRPKPSGGRRKDLQRVTLPDWKFPIRANDIVEGVVLAVSKTNCHREDWRIRSALTPQDIAWTNAKSPEEILKPGDVALFMIRSINAAEHKMAVIARTETQGPGRARRHRSCDTATSRRWSADTISTKASSTAPRRRMRQTGSVFKPFVYTAAVDRGLKPDDTIVDAPVNFGGYSPGNYDGKFKGTITIRQALAESRNIPAVKTLASVGVHNLIPYVRRFGITSKIDPYLPIALGAATSR